jgi:iron-sulfur cluster assembly accessory protein
MEKRLIMNLTIKPAAEKFIRRIIRFSRGPDAGFRLVVTAGGCAGLSANFDAAENPMPGDGVFLINGIRFFLPAESRLLLEGVTMDFVDSPLQTGFVFFDPKQKMTCGSRDSSATAAAR